MNMLECALGFIDRHGSAIGHHSFSAHHNMHTNVVEEMSPDSNFQPTADIISRPSRFL
jgi:hypothetical protein